MINLVLRGNRTVKVDAQDFCAFASPNFPPLAYIDEQGFDFDRTLCLPVLKSAHTLSNPLYRQQVSVLLQRIAQGLLQHGTTMFYLFPGMPATTLHALLAAPIKGAVIAAYGTGNAPQTPDFLAAMSAAHQRGVVLVGVTQVLRGSVHLDTYEAGLKLRQAGVISGFDMTPAAAFAKLSLCIAQGFSQGQIETSMQTVVAGEFKMDVVKQS